MPPAPVSGLNSPLKPLKLIKRVLFHVGQRVAGLDQLLDNVEPASWLAASTRAWSKKDELT